MVEQSSHIVSELLSRVSRLETEFEALKKSFEDLVPMIIDPDILKGLKNLLYHTVCNKLWDIITDQGTVTLEQVEHALQEYGLDLNNQEVAERIASSIPTWTEEKHFLIPLNELHYRDHDIVFSSQDKPDKKIYVPAGRLPFETSSVLENIKAIFEGNIEVNYNRAVRFKWDKGIKQLTISQGEISGGKTIVDDDVIKKFKRIQAAYAKLSERYDPFKAARIMIDLKPILTKRITSEQLADMEEKVYDARFIEILEKMAAHSYMTSIDFWFEIKGFLIWERPEYGAATYIFDWPEEELSYFIYRIWSSKLHDIRHDPESGYRDKVIHDYNDIDNWEANLKNKMA